MTKKRIYVVEIEFSKIFSEDKDEAFKLWSLLSSSKFKGLNSKWNDFEDKDKFCWGKDLKVELYSIVVEIYPNEKLAYKSFDNLQKIRKMGLVKTKKKI